MHREKARWELHKNAIGYLEQIQKATPYETTAVQPLTSYHKKHLSKTNKTCEMLFEKRGWMHVSFFYRPLFMNMPMLADRQELNYISTVWTQDIIWKTCWEWWMIMMDGWRKKSALATQLDDDDFKILPWENDHQTYNFLLASAQLAGLTIHCLYHLQRRNAPSQRGVLGMTLNWIWWLGSSSGDLVNVEYHYH